MTGLARRAFAFSLLIALCGTSIAALPPRFVISDRQGSTLRVFAQDAFFTGVPNFIPSTTVDSIRVGSTPQETATSPNGRIAFVANFNSGYVSVVDLTIGVEIRRIPNILARSVAVTPDGTRWSRPLPRTKS